MKIAQAKKIILTVIQTTLIYPNQPIPTMHDFQKHLNTGLPSSKRSFNVI